MMLKVFEVKILQERVFGLDILRALAIMFVVIGHGSNLLPKNYAKIIDSFVLDGVSIFFVLSGFLIGRILINLIIEHGINNKVIFKFWVRRWYRTLPNYFLILTILCLLNYFFLEDFDFGKITNYFVFSQNLIVKHPTWFFPEAWSLSVEEWFYIALPLVLFLFSLIYGDSIGKVVLKTCISIIISITVFRFYKFMHLPNLNEEIWDLEFRKLVITRLDSLTFGVLAAYFQIFHYKFWLKHKNILFYLGISLLIAQQVSFLLIENPTNFYSCVFGFSLNAIGTVFTIPFLSELNNSNYILYKPITYISLISYSMYLLNLSIIQYWIINKIPWYENIDNTNVIVILKYGLYWILLFPLSILLYKYFEVPLTNLRERKN